MQTTPDWTDLSLFSAVARAGGLVAATAETGVSAATLSRRMKSLERCIGRRLFLHGAAGYTMTAEGRALLEKVKRMEGPAAEIAQWQEAARGPVRVRLSAGTWTAVHLTRNLRKFWSPDAAWVPEFLHCNLDMDIARREIDIGIRNRRPDQPWLAGRRTGTIEFAVYGADPDVTDWIGLTGDVENTPSSLWVRKHHGDRIVTTANDPQLALDLAEAGIGRMVLPTFVVPDAVPTLQRLSPPIEELTCEEWLVAHHEGRFETGVREALDALAGFLTNPARMRDAA